MYKFCVSKRINCGFSPFSSHKLHAQLNDCVSSVWFNMPFGIQKMDWTKLDICSREELDTELEPRKFWIKSAQRLPYTAILTQLRTLGKTHFSPLFSCIKWQCSNKDKSWQWAHSVPCVTHARLLPRGMWSLKPFIILIWSLLHLPKIIYLRRSYFPIITLKLLSQNFPFQLILFSLMSLTYFTNPTHDFPPYLLTMGLSCLQLYSSEE